MFYCIGSLGSLEVEIPTMLLEGTEFFRGTSGENTRNVKFFWVMREVVMYFTMNVIGDFQVFSSSWRGILKRDLPMDIWWGRLRDT